MKLLKFDCWIKLCILLIESFGLMLGFGEILFFFFGLGVLGRIFLLVVRGMFDVGLNDIGVCWLFFCLGIGWILLFEFDLVEELWFEGKIFDDIGLILEIKFGICVNLFWWWMKFVVEDECIFLLLNLCSLFNVGSCVFEFIVWGVMVFNIDVGWNGICGNDGVEFDSECKMVGCNGLVRGLELDKDWWMVFVLCCWVSLVVMGCMELGKELKFVGIFLNWLLNIVVGCCFVLGCGIICFDRVWVWWRVVIGWSGILGVWLMLESVEFNEFREGVWDRDGIWVWLIDCFLWIICVFLWEIVVLEFFLRYCGKELLGMVIFGVFGIRDLRLM